MPVSPFDSAIYGTFLSDEAIAEQFGDDAQIASMLAFEAALARAQARCGVIPDEAARAITEALETCAIAPEDLAAGTAAAGLPVPAFVAALREAVGGDAAHFVHWGATSQDVLDTGLILRLRETLGLLDARLAALVDTLADHAERHRATVMAARTRTQQANPTSFGLKIAGWLGPLGRHRRQLAELRPRLLMVQLGGASGNLAAMGDRGLDVMEALADELDLGVPPSSLHTQRDPFVELGNWLAAVTTSLGKIGQDIVLLAQTEIGEARGGAAGGSSTLPQKANPIAAETLLTLARLNAGLVGTMHQAAIQEHERGGAGWTLEWMVLPQMVVASGAALWQALAIAETLTADPEAMRRNLDRSNGLILAEAASFALSAHMKRAEAQALVKAACEKVEPDGRGLIAVLKDETDAPVDWNWLADPANHLGVADDLITRLVASARDPFDP